MQIDGELLRKYNVSGPRYTSYPTAVQFDGSVDAGVFEHACKALPTTAPLSLYFHIPYCESLCYYCGCHKVVSKSSKPAESYVTSMLREIDLQGVNLGQARSVKQIHFGGGTPTFLAANQLGRILTRAQQVFAIDDLSQLEVSIEIDPRTTDREKLDQLVAIGFNRMSFGVQDFDPQVQQEINRIQAPELVLPLIEYAKSKVRSVSVDLIYGLPKQTIASFEQTLSHIVELKPNRIALYNYAHMPSLIKAQKMIASDTLPSPDQKLALLKFSTEVLTEEGYRYIGMDHFALEDDSLTAALDEGSLRRNFQGYSTLAGCQIVGFGVSSISSFDDLFAQNTKSVKEYKQLMDKGELAIEKGYQLSRDDRIRAAMIQQLMCVHEIDLVAFGKQWGIDALWYFAKELSHLKPLVRDNLVELSLTADEELIRVTELGRTLLRNIAMVFDAYLEQQSQRFSKAI